jgi:predicted metalloprotease with PDZ domain
MRAWIMAVVAGIAALLSGEVQGRAALAAAVGAGALDESPVAYTLTLLPGPPVAVRVTLRVRGEDDGTTRLGVAPDWGGVENCERFVHDLRVRDAAGRICDVTTDPAAPHGWDVKHEPGADLIATYELRPETPDPLGESRTHYEPVVRDDLLHLIGETGFIYPVWLEDRPSVDISFGWEGFKENGWTTVSSFDAERGEMRRPLQKFRHAMFMAGKIRVIDRDIRGGKLRTAIYGDDWAFKDAELADLIERVVGVEREFVGDFGDPYFLVSVVPMGPRATPGSFSMGGTGLTNCFALFLPPGTSVATDSPHRNGILRLLAHEYFHTWNGGKIETEEPEQLVYWFSEGFTDFYASRLLRRAGLISNSEWTDRLNETIKKLWLNPAATEPATTIQKEFWTRNDVQQLPYQRGELVALMLDEEIRRASDGKKSLDDLFRDVLADARNGEKSETERLLRRVAAWTGEDFAAKLRRIVVDGAMPEPPERISEPAAERAIIERHRFEPGFDVDGSLKDKVVSGVREGSAAFAAGLRDGQKIKGVSIYHGDPDKEIVINVVNNGDVSTVKYLPRGAAVAMPVFRLAPGN